MHTRDKMCFEIPVQYAVPHNIVFSAHTHFARPVCIDSCSYYAYMDVN